MAVDHSLHLLSLLSLPKKLEVYRNHKLTDLIEFDKVVPFTPECGLLRL